MPEKRITIIYRPDMEQPPRKGNLELNEQFLTPGRNHLTKSQFEQVVIHPELAKFKEWGSISILESVEEYKEEEAAVGYPLLGLTVGDAIAIIEEEASLMTLNDWQEKESRNRKRSSVLNAISRQIKTLERGEF